MLLHKKRLAFYIFADTMSVSAQFRAAASGALSPRSRRGRGALCPQVQELVRRLDELSGAQNALARLPAKSAPRTTLKSLSV
jgi:hypothetical protein